MDVPFTSLTLATKSNYSEEERRYYDDCRWIGKRSVPSPFFGARLNVARFKMKING